MIQAANAEIGNNYQNALDVYNKLVQLMPNDEQVQFELGEFYQQHGEFKSKTSSLADHCTLSCPTVISCADYVMDVKMLFPLTPASLALTRLRLVSRLSVPLS